jgi:V8-like Glu-specific endopeptidase
MSSHGPLCCCINQVFRDLFNWAYIDNQGSFSIETNNSTMSACGGVLINSQFVLTAGHCVKGETLEKTVILKYVRLGEFDLTSEKDCIQENNGQLDCADTPIDIPIEKIIPHPLYNPNNPSKHHDIAILKLKEKVQFSDFIQPICLPTPDLDKGLRMGQEQVVCGWGKTDLFYQKYGRNVQRFVIFYREIRSTIR